MTRGAERVGSSRTRVIVLNSALLFGSSAIALVLAEVVFGRINAAREAKLSAEEGSPQAEMARFTVYHPLLGHDGKPNARGTLRRMSVIHNSQGNRGREVTFPKPAGVRRVIVLGDSQAWGYGVADQETIAARLEVHLARPRDGTEPFEVLNLGVSGFGTDQALLKYLVQGRRYQPDYVVLIVFKNDLVENERTSAWGVSKPRFFLKDGGLCLGNVPTPRVAGWEGDAVFGPSPPPLRVPLVGFDLRRSETLRFLESRQWRWASQASVNGENLRTELGCLENRETYQGEGGDLLVRLSSLLNAKVTSGGARLLVFFTPKNKEWEDQGSHAYYEPLMQALDRGGIPTLDFRAYAGRGAPPEAPLFLPGDPHLSVLGSDLAARAIKEWIATPGL